MPRGDVSGCILRENQRDWLVGWLPSCSFLLKKMKSNSWQESNLRKIQINRIHREKKDLLIKAGEGGSFSVMVGSTYMYEGWLFADGFC